jgi:hypothetical protein
VNARGAVGAGTASEFSTTVAAVLTLAQGHDYAQPQQSRAGAADLRWRLAPAVATILASGCDPKGNLGCVPEHILARGQMVCGIRTATRKSQVRARMSGARIHGGPQIQRTQGGCASSGVKCSPSSFVNSGNSTVRAVNHVTTRPQHHLVTPEVTHTRDDVLSLGRITSMHRAGENATTNAAMRRMIMACPAVYIGSGGPLTDVAQAKCECG